MATHGKLVASCSAQHPRFGSFRVLGVDLNSSKMILFMYSTVNMLSKPLETSNDLDWSWFCESNQKFWKLSKNMRLSEIRFYQRKRIGLTLFIVSMVYKIVLNGWLCFNLVLLWKLEFIWKVIKWDELSETLELIGIGLWCLYAYATVIICL